MQYVPVQQANGPVETTLVQQALPGMITPVNHRKCGLKAPINGAFDLHGNVREWVSDNYSDVYYSEVTDGVVNPQGPAAPSSGTKRSQRGGYYGSKKADIRSANRHSSTHTTHSSTSGFRVCADP